MQLRDLRAKAATDLSLMIDDERARKHLDILLHVPLNITSEKEKPLNPNQNKKGIFKVKGLFFVTNHVPKRFLKLIDFIKL